MAHLLLSWLLPPICGAVLGFLLGAFALGRIARAIVLHRGASIARAAAEPAGAFASDFLAMRAASLVPAAGTASARRLEDTFAGILSGILGSRSTIYAVRDAVSKAVAGMASRGVGETAQKLGIEKLLSEKVLAALGTERTRTSLGDSAGRLVAEHAGSGIDDEVVRELSGVVDSAVPGAADAVVRWLRSPETRADLAERGRELLPRILEKLTELQKLFLSAAQLDRRLDEKMPEIIDETVAALEKMARDPRQQKRVVEVFSDAARGWRDSLRGGTVEGGLDANEKRRKLAEAVTVLVDRFLARLGDPAQRRATAARAAERLDHDRRTLGAFVRDSLGLAEPDIVEIVSDRVLRALTGPEMSRKLAAGLVSLAAAKARELPETTVASALGIDESRGRDLEEALRAAAPGVVQRALPRILREPRARRGTDLLLGVLGAAAGLLAGVAASVMRLAGV